MRGLLIAAIGFYQRVLSPRKGYRCAYGHHTGRASCSHLGYRAVRRFGVWRGLLLLRRRVHLCGVAHRRHALMPLHAQRGVIDLDCGALDAVECCGDVGSCDWPDWKNRKAARKEKQVHRPTP